MAEMQRNGAELLPPGSGEESPKADRPKKHWLKKLVKVTIWLVIFVVIHGIFILTLHFTLLRARSPKYRLRSVAIEKLSDVNNNGTKKTPRFNMQLNSQVTLKNTNLGTYTFGDGNLTFSYKGMTVGQAVVIKSSTGIWSTKIMRIILNVTFPVGTPSSNPRLVEDVASGLVPMTANSVLRGKVRFFMVIHKKKSTNMNCNFTVNLLQKAVQELKCS